MIVNKGFNTDEFYNRILFESQNFKVIPSLGSLVEGWLLVIPKKHYISYGEITNSLLLEELEMLIYDVSKAIQNEYGEYIIFEHGPIVEMSSVGCGVDYAHIHIVPINLVLKQIKELSGQTIQWEKVESINSTSFYTNSGQSYLYFQDNHRNSYIGTSDKIPSQFFRRVISEVIGKPKMFDWNNHFFLDNITNTYKRLKNYSEVNNLTKLSMYA